MEEKLESKKVFRVHVEETVCGDAEVEANSPEEARDIVLRGQGDIEWHNDGSQEFAVISAHEQHYDGETGKWVGEDDYDF